MSRFRMMFNSMAKRSYVRKRFITTSLMLGIGAGVFQLIGAVGPSWIYVDERVSNKSNVNPEWYLQEGLWLAKYCYDYGHHCRTAYREKVIEILPTDVIINANPGPHWLEFQILSIVSIISSAITAVTLYFIQRRHDIKYDQPVLIVSGLFSVLSCTTLLIPEVKTWYVNKSANVIDAWSRTIAALGTTLQFITTTILLFAVYHTRVLQLQRDQKHERRRREMMKTRVLVMNLADDESPWSTNVEQTRMDEDTIQQVPVPMTIVSGSVESDRTEKSEHQTSRNVQESFADFSNVDDINQDGLEKRTKGSDDLNAGDKGCEFEKSKSDFNESRICNMEDISQSVDNNKPFANILSAESTI